MEGGVVCGDGRKEKENKVGKRGEEGGGDF